MCVGDVGNSHLQSTDSSVKAVSGRGSTCTPGHDGWELPFLPQGWPGQTVRHTRSGLGGASPGVEHPLAAVFHPSLIYCLSRYP